MRENALLAASIYRVWEGCPKMISTQDSCDGKADLREMDDIIRIRFSEGSFDRVARPQCGHVQAAGEPFGIAFHAVPSAWLSMLSAGGRWKPCRRHSCSADSFDAVLMLAGEAVTTTTTLNHQQEQETTTNHL